MTEELKLIMELMPKKTNIDTLKTIKKMLEQNANPECIRNIYDTDSPDVLAQFLLSSRIMLVNYRKMKEYIEKVGEETKKIIPTVQNKDKKMIELLTAYRILLHEMHHSKQIHNVFDINKQDLESQIIKGLYNFDEKELEHNDKSKIIEEKTNIVNIILRPYSEINPIERKAEIESFKKIKEIIKPIKEIYPKVYDEIEMEKLSNMYNGYQNGVPYEQIINIIDMNNLKYKLPYSSPTKNEFYNKIMNQTTETQRLELGLKVLPDTLENTFNNLKKIYTRYN